MRKNSMAYIGLFVLAVGFALLVVFNAPNLFRVPDHNVASLSEWTDTASSDGVDAITLPATLHFDTTNEMTLTTQLPEGLPATQYLCFWSCRSSVEVLLDGQSIYHFANSAEDSFAQSSSSRWNFVPLRDDAGGKTLTLHFATSVKNAHFSLDEVLLGDVYSLNNWVHIEYAPYLFIENVFIWIGAFLFIAALLLKKEHPYRWYQVFAGIFITLFGLYMRTGSKTLPLYWVSDYAKDFISYFCLFFIAIPMVLFVRQKMLNHHPRSASFCGILVQIQCLATLVCFMLHTFRVVRMEQTMLVGFIMTAISATAVLVLNIWHLHLNPAWHTALSALSSTLMLAIGIAEYAHFYQFHMFPWRPTIISHVLASLILIIEMAEYFYYRRQALTRQRQLEEDNRNLQLELLTDRIRPHFILNTIGAIRSLIHTNPDRASDLLYDFSNYIRDNLNERDYFSPIPFTEELRHIETYLSLERARFGDSIRVSIDCRDTTFRVLPLTIQPFVENAVKHGLLSRESGGHLRISTTVTPNGHRIEIVDNGVGFDTNQLSDTTQNPKSIGLRSAVMRLKNQMHATVSIHSDATGTRVFIHIPQRKE